MKLRVCFLWHMHQPYYKDPETGDYALPWVRLHAIKDYVALPRIFGKYPKVRQTFNLVPSLLLQVRDYVENGAQDAFLSVSRKDALSLTRDEERFILRNFFSAFPPTMIFPLPRYEELYHRREAALEAVGRQGVQGGFGASDYIDLVCLFNLAWFHPLHRDEDPELGRLWSKGRDFTEKEKHYILDRQLSVMAEMIPEYRKYAEEGGGELSSSPMYHPILPLLIDNRAAAVANPGASMPRHPFSWPVDARVQLERGRAYFKELFGKDPDGLWPSEGSISPDTVELAAGAGFRWGATDEILLSRSLGRTVHRDADGIPREPEWLYRPYRAETPSGSMVFFFRDHHLSDRIGFEYSRWDPRDAANDFVNKLRKIRDKLSEIASGTEEFVVPIILDGENAWEYYPESGREFLSLLFSKLEELSDEIECITFSEAAAGAESFRTLPAIPTGSWIDGTFYIWIGHDEDRAAWDLLSGVRSEWQARAKESAEAGAPPGFLSEAYEHILVAEGSDWCWWYGDDHFTPHGPTFDAIFRHHIKAAYQLLGAKPPDSVDIPILKDTKMPSGKNFIPTPKSFISPRVTGELASYFDWSGASRYVPMPEYGAMHRAGFGLLNTLYYGFSRTELFFRLDLHPSISGGAQAFTVEFLFPKKGKKAVVEADPSFGTVRGRIDPVDRASEGGIPSEDGDAPPSREALRTGFGKVLVLEVPFRSLGCLGDERIEFTVTIRAQGDIGERWPMYGTFTADLPGSDFEVRMWQI